MASKRAELLAENPIIPNTNVGSKLKEMLAEKLATTNPKKNREKPKGKWDDIMSQIAEGQKRSGNAEKLKEVKSKVFADFKPPKLIRGANSQDRACGSNKKLNETSSKKYASSTRSNSTLSSSNGLLDHHPKKLSCSSRQSSIVAVSRSTSSASVASQVVIIKETPDEDNVSECTLKDLMKKVANNGGAMQRKGKT